MGAAEETLSRSAPGADGRLRHHIAKDERLRLMRAAAVSTPVLMLTATPIRPVRSGSRRLSDQTPYRSWRSTRVCALLEQQGRADYVEVLYPVSMWKEGSVNALVNAWLADLRRYPARTHRYVQMR